MHKSFCEEELKYLRNNIKINNRIDSREINEERKSNYVLDTLISADRSLEIVVGKTRILVSIIFKSTLDTVRELLSEDKLGINEICQKCEKNDINEEVLELCFVNDLGANDNCTLFLKDTIMVEKKVIFRNLIDVLKNNKIGAVIETRIIENDGNVFDTFFKSLNILFASIKIPNVHKLDEEVINKIQIPLSRTYALFENNKMVRDPTLLEEESCQGLVHFMENNQIFFNGCIKYEDIDNLLNYK